MPLFTIEASYRIPVYRHRTYEAGTLEEACRLAIADDDWSGQKEDYESADETYVSGVWPGADTAYRVAATPVPFEFGDVIKCKVDHFEMMLGLLKILAPAADGRAPDISFWRSRTETAVQIAEAILSRRDPSPFESRTHALLWLDEARVRHEVITITGTDWVDTPLMADDIIDADIHAACLAVVAETNLSEERGAAEYRAAYVAIREAERRLASAFPASTSAPARQASADEQASP
jgi:hypothetical protein